MEHLTREQIYEFVSIKRGSEEEIAKAKKVNAHLMICEECRKRVRAIQDVYDRYAGTTSDDDGRSDPDDAFSEQ